MAVGQLVHLANSVTDSSANSISCTVPNNGTVAVGDLLIWATVIASGSRTFASSGVSNISFAGSAAVTGHGTHVWYKIVESGDLGSVITCTPSTGAVKMGMLLGYVTGADTTNPFSSPAEVSGAGTLTSSTTKTTPTVTATAGGREISIVADSRNASSPNSDWTSGAATGETFRGEAVTATSAGNQYSTIAWGDSDTTVSGSTGARVWTATQAAPGSAWTLIVKTGTSSITDSDVGSASNETVTVSISDGDLSSALETQSLSATSADSDLSLSTETSTIDATLSDSDLSGTALDTENIVQGASDGDLNAGTEGQSISATLNDSDTPLGTETHSIAATLSDSDTPLSVESQTIDATISDSDQVFSNDTGSATAGASTTPSDTEGGSSGESWSIQIFNAPVAERSLVLGPASLYIAPFGAVEPANGSVASAPDPLVWTDLGGILGGVGLSVDQEWEEIRPKQVGYTVTRRMTKRLLSIKTQLAEHTLTNLAYALNDLDSKTSGSGWEAYTPAEQHEGTVLPYVAVLVDGWAPGANAGGRHKRRRLVVRKCLSIDNVEFAYSKDNQSVYTVTWSCHYVDSTTPIFRVVDEA